ncbi:MAG: hypothetical protein SAK29_15200 [Scytonema sp. PMC 1069.18]|nr:hypothetical protein [Scytonema sp. PMC 1069.18]MEC4883744.1 hypothetical protein [Scytonema sp. PMC 1070.18]
MTNQNVSDNEDFDQPQPPQSSAIAVREASPTGEGGRKSAIAIPSDWDLPKFNKLGMLTQQGVIMGMQYYALGTKLAYSYKPGWRYYISRGPMCDDTDLLDESEINLLHPNELRSEIEAEIKFHLSKITSLREQLQQLS